MVQYDPVAFLGLALWTGVGHLPIKKKKKKKKKIKERDDGTLWRERERERC